LQEVLLPVQLNTPQSCWGAGNTRASGGEGGRKRRGGGKPARGRAGARAHVDGVARWRPWCTSTSVTPRRRTWSSLKGITSRCRTSSCSSPRRRGLPRRRRSTLRSPTLKPPRVRLRPPPCVCARARAPLPCLPLTQRDLLACRDPPRAAPARLLPRRVGARCAHSTSEPAGTLSCRRGEALGGPSDRVHAPVQSTPIPGRLSPRTRA